MFGVTISSLNSYAQFFSVLIVFILVLGLSVFTTKWIAKYQKQQYVNNNIELLDTAKIAPNKYIQLVRVGETYIAIAVCKDSVTTLCQISKEQIKQYEKGGEPIPFKQMLESVLKKGTNEKQNDE